MRVEVLTSNDFLPPLLLRILPSSYNFERGKTCSISGARCLNVNVHSIQRSVSFQVIHLLLSKSLNLAGANRLLVGAKRLRVWGETTWGETDFGVGEKTVILLLHS